MSRITLRSIMLVGTAVLLAGTTPRTAQLPGLDALMQQKLEQTERLLEAVMRDRNLDVERYANELKLLSDVSTWTTLESDEYYHYAAEFQDVADELMEEARVGHGNGIAYTFTELVLVCTDCHAYVRGASRQANRSPGDE